MVARAEPAAHEPSAHTARTVSLRERSACDFSSRCSIRGRRCAIVSAGTNKRTTDLPVVASHSPLAGGRQRSAWAAGGVSGALIRLDCARSAMKESARPACGSAGAGRLPTIRRRARTVFPPGVETAWSNMNGPGGTPGRVQFPHRPARNNCCRLNCRDSQEVDQHLSSSTSNVKPRGEQRVQRNLAGLGSAPTF